MEIENILEMKSLYFEKNITNYSIEIVKSKTNCKKDAIM